MNDSERQKTESGVPRITLSDTMRLENIKDLEEMIALLRELSEKKKIQPGCRFYVEDGKVHAGWLKSVPPRSDEENRREAEVVLGKALRVMGVVRHSLSRSFDLTSKEWNDSNLGKSLKNINDKYRTQLNRVQSTQTPADMMEVTFLFNSVFKLNNVYVEFQGKSRAAQDLALRNWADDYVRDAPKRDSFTRLSNTAAMFLAIDSIRGPDGKRSPKAEQTLLDMLPDLKKLGKICRELLDK